MSWVLPLRGIIVVAIAAHSRSMAMGNSTSDKVPVEQTEQNQTEQSREKAKKEEIKKFIQLWQTDIEHRSMQIYKLPSRPQDDKIGEQFGQDALKEIEEYLQHQINTQTDESKKKLYERQLKNWNACKEDLQCIEEMYRMGLHIFLRKMKSIFLDEIKELWFQNAPIHAWKSKNNQEKMSRLETKLFLFNLREEDNDET